MNVGNLEDYGLESETVLYLERVLALNEFEGFVVRVLAAGELDNGVRVFFEKLDEEGEGFFSILALMRAYRTCMDPEMKQKPSERFQELYRSFLKGRTLADWILEPGKDGSFSLRETLKLSVRIRDLVLGEQWDLPELEEDGRWFWPGESDRKNRISFFGEELYQKWSRHALENKGSIVLLEGPEGIGKKTQVTRFGKDTGRPVFLADARQIAWWQPGKEELRLKNLMRECRIKQSILCLDHVRAEDWGGERLFLLEKILLLAKSCLWGIILLTEEPIPWLSELNGTGRMFRVSFSMPDLSESARLWREIGEEYPVDHLVKLEEFAGTVRMTPGQMRDVFERAMEIAVSEKSEAGGISGQMIKDACAASGGRKAGRKTTRVPLKYGFQDLVLPSGQLRQLKEACSQVRNRYLVYETWGFSEKQAYGLGISMVFSGSPGTGKTMAAQIMAKELGLELYKVDLSAVVSKYIGETEKNLDQIFEEGKQSQAILFFDEADVLFSKRTEVKDSHDKYSNMEAAFMLQKMEEYTGVVILATNYMQNIDEAFKRRLTFMIEFPAPDLENRKKLWQSVIPKKLPVKGDLDFDFLAQHFEMSGSQIKNSMINGAFLAADRWEDGVGMKEILQAVIKELAKSGRKLNSKDLGEYSLLLGEADDNDGI